jgi:hypothetical protein
MFTGDRVFLSGEVSWNIGENASHPYRGGKIGKCDIARRFFDPSKIGIIPPIPGRSNEGSAGTPAVRPGVCNGVAAGAADDAAEHPLTYIEGKFREKLTRKIENFWGEWSSPGVGTRTAWLC